LIFKIITGLSKIQINTTIYAAGMKYFSPIFLFVLLLCKGNILRAQINTDSDGKNLITKNNIDSSSKIKVISITITGNKKTKSYIILNEIQFKTGDSIIAGELYQNLIAAKQQVYNTSLFTEVQITPELIDGFHVIIHVAVKEKWYIFPTPQFQLIDRNFNDWIKTYNASLSRVIYGAKFAHYNLSGRNDKLRIYLLNGYARNIAFNYTAPASNPKLNNGFSLAAGYTQSREISYKTSYNNKLLQYKQDNYFVKNSLVTEASYSHRNGLFKRHVFTLQYQHQTVTDSIVSNIYNPSYFGNGQSGIGFTDASYYYQYIRTNNNSYPLTGKIFSIQFLKRGLGFTGGVNMLSTEALFNKYFTHKNNWYSSIELSTKIKLPFEQPYINQQAFGFRDFYLRGLEYYVIDGVAAALAKYTLKKKMVSFSIPVPFHIRTIPRIPFTIFAKTYADVGYSYTKPEYDTRLSNRLLYTTGFGLDILTIYDFNFRIEYSFNQLGENGLFLHAKGSF
jgi:outer membrane protein assembly factor BamA